MWCLQNATWIELPDLNSIEDSSKLFDYCASYHKNISVLHGLADYLITL